MDVQPLAEYRYRAVREVLGEAAARYDTSRQTLHSWRRRSELEGMPGLLGPLSAPAKQPHAPVRG
ncbi:hypothetical protein ACWD3J_49530 [Streptomyces sp. NPDC002755]|uniref:hypothetical protein n=1 Tax=Streptomyces sp. NPDC002884 TaxID=3154544 RepID=UPI0033315EF3